MIVKDLLLQCAVKDIISAVIEKAYNDDNQELVGEVYGRLIQELKSREPIEQNYVVLGVDLMGFGEQLSDANLYEINDIKKSFKIIPQLEEITDINQLSDNEIEKILKEVKLPQSYGYELSEWNEIIGYKIDEQNAERYGKAKLLANILYEMTFFGFDECTVKKERESLQESADELDEILNLPEEEQKKHLFRWEDLKAELDLEENSPKEQEHMEMSSNRERLHNLMQIYTLLKEYRKHLI